MVERKSSIPNTSIYNQLNQYRWDIYNHVIAQMDLNLALFGEDMIGAPIQSKTITVHSVVLLIHNDIIVNL